MLFLLQFGKIGTMELKDLIQAHLAETNERQSKLAHRAGVHPCIISRILSGKQGDVSGKNYQRILDALKEIEVQHS